MNIKTIRATSDAPLEIHEISINVISARIFLSAVFAGLIYWSFSFCCQFAVFLLIKLWISWEKMRIFCSGRVFYEATCWNVFGVHSQCRDRFSLCSGKAHPDKPPTNGIAFTTSHTL
jgi:hypothetical protein